MFFSCPLPVLFVSFSQATPQGLQKETPGEKETLQNEPRRGKTPKKPKEKRLYQKDPRRRKVTPRAPSPFIVSFWCPRRRKVTRKGSQEEKGHPKRIPARDKQKETRGPGGEKQHQKDTRRRNMRRKQGMCLTCRRARRTTLYANDNRPHALSEKLGKNNQEKKETEKDMKMKRTGGKEQGHNKEKHFLLASQAPYCFHNCTNDMQHSKILCPPLSLSLSLHGL